MSANILAFLAVRAEKIWQVSDEKLADEKIVQFQKLQVLLRFSGHRMVWNSNFQRMAKNSLEVMATRLARAFSTDPSYMLLDEPTVRWTHEVNDCLWRG